MSDKETICRVSFVNNNPDDKVFQPYPSGDYTAIKTAELTDLKRQLKDWQCLNDSNSRLNAHLERRLAESCRLRVEIEREKVVLKRQLEQYSPLKPPSDEAREVFAVTAEKEGADMRAVPNQWVLNERARASEAVADLEEELAEAKFEIKNIHC